jgi:hypothetical protein
MYHHYRSVVKLSPPPMGEATVPREYQSGLSERP